MSQFVVYGVGFAKHATNQGKDTMTAVVGFDASSSVKA